MGVKVQARAEVRCKACKARVGAVWVGGETLLVDKDPVHVAGNARDPRTGLALLIHDCDRFAKSRPDRRPS